MNRCELGNVSSSLWNPLKSCHCGLIETSITKVNSVLRWTLNVLIFYCHRILNLLKIPFNTQFVLLACMVSLFICLWASVCVTVGCLISGSPEKFLSLSIMTTRSCMCVNVCANLSFLFVIYPCVCLTVRVCCLYCVVYIVLPYLNNKTGYEIQNQYPSLLLLIPVCVCVSEYKVVHSSYRLG